jgi:recombination protein RecT
MGNGDEPKMPVTVESKRRDIKSFFDNSEFKSQIEMALPKICTVERFIRVALTAVNKTPKLMDCTRESLLACLYGCAELGIEPDGRRAHLIPYGDKCTLIIDYKGKVELAMRSGTVANIHADKICANDLFRFDRGEVKEHLIDFRTDRGEPYAYYCIIRFKDGTEKAEVMTKAEVDAIRKRSKAATSGPWVTDFDEMAKKTVFHRASKWVTLSPELRRAEELDDDRLDPLPVSMGFDKNDVAAPRSKSEAKTTEAQVEDTHPVAPDLRREYEELIELAGRASKKVQEQIRDIKEAFCKKYETTPEDFTVAQFAAIIPQIREALR